MVYTNFFSSIRKQRISPWFTLKIKYVKNYNQSIKVLSKIHHFRSFKLVNKNNINSYILLYWESYLVEARAPESVT